MPIVLTDSQARTLAEVIEEHYDGEEVTLTPQGDGSLVVGFSLATVTIHVDGYYEEN